MKNLKKIEEQKTNKVKRLEEIFGVEIDIDFNHFIKGRHLFCIDIFSLDRRLSEKDPEYDYKNATYRGETHSMEDYITVKFGEEANRLLKEVI